MHSREREREREREKERIDAGNSLGKRAFFLNTLDIMFVCFIISVLLHNLHQPDNQLRAGATGSSKILDRRTVR